jgi:two-component system response regulator FixJ
MAANRQTVFIVDDDEAVRDSLRFLLKSVGLASACYTSGDQFLAEWNSGQEGCILLDIRMPGSSGMEVQRKLREQGCELPIIFITGHGDIEMAVQAMHHGAFDFVQKPFRDQELLERINQALAVQRERRDEQHQREQIRKRYESLTPREKEVMKSVVLGHANKVIAFDLDLSQRTVEIHRARVMEKMEARSLADLVRMAILLEGGKTV